MMKTVFKIIFLALFSSSLFAGPFGLSKGMSLSQIDKNAKKTSENTYNVKVPKPNPEFELYLAQVSPKHGLIKIIAVGKTHTVNAFGDALKDVFNAYEEKLKNIYGKNRKFDFVKSGSIWDEDKYWMMGLLKEERYHRAFWSQENGSSLKEDIQTISLDTIASDTSSGYIRLIYEFSGFDEFLDEIKSKKDDTL